MILMNSFIVALIIAGSFPGSPPSDTGITDLEIYRLKGNVKSVMETRYLKGEGDESDGTPKVIYQKFTAFNEDGYITRSILFNEGKAFLRSDYVFGSDGKQVEMKEYHPDGSLNVDVLYSYNDKGFRTRADYLWAEGRQVGDFYGKTDYYYELMNNDLFTKIIYKNEYRGFCTEENYLKYDSSLSFKFVSKYDFRGNKLETGYYHGNERLSWMTKNKYDKFDNMVESRVYKSNRIAVITKYTYQFDPVGNWTLRQEAREVFVNILTAGLQQGDMFTERKIEYY